MTVACYTDSIGFTQFCCCLCFWSTINFILGGSGGSGAPSQPPRQPGRGPPGPPRPPPGGDPNPGGDPLPELPVHRLETPRLRRAEGVPWEVASRGVEPCSGSSRFWGLAHTRMPRRATLWPRVGPWTMADSSLTSPLPYAYIGLQKCTQGTK